MVLLLACVMSSTVALALDSDGAMASSVTFALCLFHASRPFSAEERRSQLTATRNPPLARLISAEAGTRLAGDRWHGVHGVDTTKVFVKNHITGYPSSHPGAECCLIHWPETHTLTSHFVQREPRVSKEYLPLYGRRTPSSPYI